MKIAIMKGIGDVAQFILSAKGLIDAAVQTNSAGCSSRLCWITGEQPSFQSLGFCVN